MERVPTFLLNTPFCPFNISRFPIIRVRLCAYLSLKPNHILFHENTEIYHKPLNHWNQQTAPNEWDSEWSQARVAPSPGREMQKDYDTEMTFVKSSWNVCAHHTTQSQVRGWTLCDVMLRRYRSTRLFWDLPNNVRSLNVKRYHLTTSKISASAYFTYSWNV